MDLRSNFRREILDNGVTLLFEKRDFPIASVSIASKIGAIYETENEKGLTHFMEHLLLKGTKNKEGIKFIKELEEAGGEFNAFTSKDLVKVWFKSSDNFVDRGLDILIDIVKNSLFRKEDLEKERKIIFQEIDMINDSPEEYSLEKIESTLYCEPFSLPLIGDKKNLKKFGRKDLLKKYEEVFSPENLIVCIVGNYSFESLRDKIKKSFKKNPQLKKTYPKIEKKISQISEKRKGVDQSRLLFSFYSPFSDDKRIFSLNVLYCILNGGLSSRLYTKFRYKEAIVYESGGGVISSQDYSFTYFEFGCSEKKSPELKGAFLKNLKRFQLI